MQVPDSLNLELSSWANLSGEGSYLLDWVNLCTMKKYAEVLSESEEIIKRYPKSHRVLNVVGVANSALGKYEIAIDIYLGSGPINFLRI